MPSPKSQRNDVAFLLLFVKWTGHCAKQSVWFIKKSGIGGSSSFLQAVNTKKTTPKRNKNLKFIHQIKTKGMKLNAVGQSVWPVLKNYLSYRRVLIYRSCNSGYIPSRLLETPSLATQRLRVCRFINEWPKWVAHRPCPGESNFIMPSHKDAG